MPVWNNTFEANPKGTDTPAEGDDRIRELKAATRERIEHEHTMNLGSGVVGEDGWHRAGSAKVYVGANAPTHRPNGSAVLDAQDDGRLWLSSVDFSLRAYRHAAGSTTSERWEIVSGSGGSGENYVKNNLTKPNIAGVFNDTTGTTTVSWDATATDLLNVGALKIVLTNAAVGRFVDIDLSPLNANNVGQQWSIKLSYKLATAADDLVSFFLFDGTTEVPTTLNSLPYGGGVLQKAVGAVYPTNVLNNVRLRLRFKDSTACTLYLADLTVGPFNPYGGAAIGNWTSYTPTFSEFGTVSAIEFFYRRVGNNMEIRGKFASGTPTANPCSFTLPSGYSVGNGQPANYIEVGRAARAINYIGEKDILLISKPFEQKIYFGILNSTVAENPLVPVRSGAIVQVNDYLSILCSVPIAQWTSNINLVQDFQEFASNSSIADASDITSFAYGSEGSPISFSLFSARTRRVRFLKPIQPTDILTLEFYCPIGKTWNSGSLVFVNNERIVNISSGTSGAAIKTSTALPATDIEVLFYTYRVDTIAWSTGTTGARWRVRKISNGNMAEVPVQVQVPIGTVHQFAGAAAKVPVSYLLCDGAEISRSTYAELYSILGDTWGAGNGTTTFNLPDMRGAAPAGVGTTPAFYTQAETIALGQKYNDQMQGHRHPAMIADYATGNTGGSAFAKSGVAFRPIELDFETGNASKTDGTNGTPRTGNVTRGKRVGINFIIKATR